VQYSEHAALNFCFVTDHFFLGFNVSRKVLLPIVRRYGGKQRSLSFQDFVIAMTKVMSMYRKYFKHMQ
jgi:hypothetical protein